MVKIEVIEACVGEDFAYSEGVYEVPTTNARSLISAGIAKPIKKIERNVTKKGRKSGVSKADNSTKL